MDNFSRGVAIAVTAVWVVIALAGAYTHDNSTLIEVTPIMFIVAGFLFGIKIIKPGSRSSDDFEVVKKDGVYEVKDNAKNKREEE